MIERVDITPPEPIQLHARHISAERIERMVENHPEIFKVERPRCSKGIAGCMKVHAAPVLDWDAADWGDYWEELHSPKGIRVWARKTEPAESAHSRNLRRAVKVAVGLGAVVGLWLLLHVSGLPLVWR